MFSNPYFHCFYQLIVMVVYAQKNIGAGDPVVFVFDEQGKEGRAIRDLWSILRFMVPDDDVKAIMELEPVFGDDKEFLPLQAADLAAWQIRRYLNTPPDDAGRAPDFGPVMVRLGEIPQLEYILDRKKLASFIEQYDQMDLAKLAELL